MLSYFTYFLSLSAIIAAYNYEYDVNLKFDLMKRYKIENTDKVELRVYYECLCASCQYLHTDILVKIYKKIGSYIDLKTYPYGNAKRSEENGKTVITCQHGPAECYGNKLHGCAIDILKNVSQSEFYNSCMMSAQWGGWGSTDMDATKCGQALGIDSKPIIECAKSQRGEDLLEYYGSETRKVDLTNGVPVLLLNGRYFDAFNYDLMHEICRQLKNPPASCEE